jgi:hypothetical protein
MSKVKLAKKMMLWHYFDIKNRRNILFRKPVFGEDCRKAVKVNLVLGDIFEVKRHKNTDSNSRIHQYS